MVAGTLKTGKTSGGSVFECVPLLELCKREKLIAENVWADLKAELEVLAKMLTALIARTDKRNR